MRQRAIAIAAAERARQAVSCCPARCCCFLRSCFSSLSAPEYRRLAWRGRVVRGARDEPNTKLSGREGMIAPAA